MFELFLTLITLKNVHIFFTKFRGKTLFFQHEL